MSTAAEVRSEIVSSVLRGADAILTTAIGLCSIGVELGLDRGRTVAVALALKARLPLLSTSVGTC